MLGLWIDQLRLTPRHPWHSELLWLELRSILPEQFVTAGRKFAKNSLWQLWRCPCWWSACWEESEVERAHSQRQTGLSWVAAAAVGLMFAVHYELVLSSPHSSRQSLSLNCLGAWLDRAILTAQFQSLKNKVLILEEVFCVISTDLVLTLAHSTPSLSVE